MRPKIISHMVSSVDGRLLCERWTPPAAGVAPDLICYIYEQVAARLDTDGWIVGRVTMQDYAHGQPRHLPDPGVDLHETFIAPHQQTQLAIVADPHGKLHYGCGGTDCEHYVAILGAQVSNAYLAELRRDGVSYLFAGQDGLDLPLALETLARDFGASTLLLEGGGILNGAFLKAGLIDELSLLIYPGIDGLSGVPGIFDHHGTANEQPAAGQALRHVGTETLEDGVVWICYHVEQMAKD